MPRGENSLTWVWHGFWWHGFWRRFFLAPGAPWNFTLGFKKYPMLNSRNPDSFQYQISGDCLKNQIADREGKCSRVFYKNVKQQDHRRSTQPQRASRARKKIHMHNLCAWEHYFFLPENLLNVARFPRSSSLAEYWDDNWDESESSQST